MNVEQRLHQAAHEIREIQVDVPTFVAPSSASGGLRRVAPILAVSLVMFFGLAAVVSRSDGVPSAAAERAADVAAELGEPDLVDTVAPSDRTRRAGVLQLTPREEVAMIASLIDTSSRSTAQTTDLRVPTGVS